MATRVRVSTVSVRLASLGRECKFAMEELIEIRETLSHLSPPISRMRIHESQLCLSRYPTPCSRNFIFPAYTDLLCRQITISSLTSADTTLEMFVFQSETLTGTGMQISGGRFKAPDLQINGIIMSKKRVLLH